MHIDELIISLESLTTSLEEDKIYANYMINEGQFSKHGSWVVSGVDLQTTSVADFWEYVVSGVEDKEGIV